MVEKVFISPNRVRAYGNIVNMKTGDDFTLVNSELTVTTDTVDGAEMTVFSMEVEPRITVTATNPYLLSGETTDVVVKLERGLGEPVPNKNVTIGQSVFLDEGTTASHNDHYWTLSSFGTITRQTNDTKILNTSGTNAYMGYYVVPMDKTINETNTYGFNAPCIIEFDITDTSNSTVTNCNFQIYSNTTSDSVMENITTSRIGHWKIIWGETEQKVYVDDTLIGTYNKTLTNARITFRARNNYYLCFKNLKIYKTINGVTDEKGEFALYDVSVTDNTIFNATYGTETATCLVEYCRFVDYAVKDNHNHNYFNQAGTSKVTITEADEYKEFKTISTTAGNVYIGSSTSFTGFDVGDTWTIIWEKLYIDGYNVAFQCYNGSTTVGINSTALLAHNSDFQELKFVCDGSSIKAYVDGVYKTQTSYTPTGHGYLRISLNNNNGASQVTFRAKNIRIK